MPGWAAGAQAAGAVGTRLGSLSGFAVFTGVREPKPFREAAFCCVPGALLAAAGWRDGTLCVPPQHGRQRTPAWGGKYLNWARLQELRQAGVLAEPPGAVPLACAGVLPSQPSGTGLVSLPPPPNPCCDLFISQGDEAGVGRYARTPYARTERLMKLLVYLGSLVLRATLMRADRFEIADLPWFRL